MVAHHVAVDLPGVQKAQLEEQEEQHAPEVAPEVAILLCPVVRYDPGVSEKRRAILANK